LGGPSLQRRNDERFERQAECIIAESPPDDKPSGYNYKVRSSGLADFSRLRENSTGVHPRANTD